MKNWIHWGALLAIAAIAAPLRAQQQENLRFNEAGQAAHATAQELQAEDSSATEAKSSEVSSPHVIAGVLLKMEDELGKDLHWTFPNNPYAKSVEGSFSRLVTEWPKLSNYAASEIQIGGVDKVNAFLKSQGFGIQLQPVTDPKAVAAAATIKIPVEWAREGSSTTVQLKNGPRVPAAYIHHAQGFYKSNLNKFPIVELATKTGEKVFLTRYEGPASPAPSAVYMQQLAQSLSASKAAIDPWRDGVFYGGVIFPKVSFERQSKLPLVGAWAYSAKMRNTYSISQFLLEQKVTMDEQGAHFESAGAGVAMPAAVPAPPLVIDGNFLFWVEANGAIPFAGVITQADMKDPKSAN